MIKTVRLGADDWSTLRHLRLGALSGAPGALVGDHVIESARSGDEWRRLCGVERWFAAMAGARSVGLAKLAQPAHPSDGLHIESMWVTPTFRSRGVGRAILTRLELEARTLGYREIRLWLLKGNLAVRRFYARHGYVGPLRSQNIPTGHFWLTEYEFQKRLGD